MTENSWVIMTYMLNLLLLLAYELKHRCFSGDSVHIVLGHMVLGEVPGFLWIRVLLYSSTVLFHQNVVMIAVMAEIQLDCLSLSK